jgi:hypothetical protein
VTANGIREKKQPKAIVASSIQVDARMPTALRKERFRVAHLEDVANSTALVGRMLIVGLHDTITDPVAQIAGFLECSIEEPVRKIGLILVGNEGRLSPGLGECDKTLLPRFVNLCLNKCIVLVSIYECLTAAASCLKLEILRFESALRN